MAADELSGVEEIIGDAQGVALPIDPAEARAFVLAEEKKRLLWRQYRRQQAVEQALKEHSSNQQQARVGASTVWDPNALAAKRFNPAPENKSREESPAAAAVRAQAASEVISLDDIIPESDEKTLSDITHLGWLSQQSGFLIRRSWRKKWFVLKNGYLSCFRNDSSRKATMNIPIYDVVGLEMGQIGSKTVGFSIITPKKTHVLMASSEEDVRGWLAALQQARVLARKEGFKPSNRVQDILY